MSSKPSSSRLFTFLLAVLTVGGMTLFFNLYDPWMPIGPDQIIDSGFETAGRTNDWTGWDSELARIDPEGGFNGSAGAVLSTAPKRHGRLKATIGEIENIPAFRVSARAAAENVERGSKRWHLPRAIFVYRDSASGKPLYQSNHILIALDQNSEWRKYTAVFPVPENVREGWLQLQNFGNAGTLRIDDVSVTPVAPKPSALFFNVFFTGLWGTVFAVCLAALHPWKRWPGTGAMLCAVAIIIGVILPGKLLDQTISSGLDTLQGIRHSIEPPAKQPADKLTQKMPAPGKEKKPPRLPDRDSIQNVHKSGHFWLFTLLALLSMSCWASARKPASGILSVMAGLFLFAAATEVLQFVTLDRKAGLSDLWVDITGISIAVAVATALSLPVRFQKRRKARTAATNGF